MTTVTKYCDHCGAVLPPHTIPLEVDVCELIYEKPDLCDKCKDKLAEMIKKFISAYSIRLNSEVGEVAE